MRPRLSLSIPLMARCTTRNEPVRFVSITSVKSASFMRIRSMSRVMPALATSTSTGPYSASMALKASLMLSASRTSALTAKNSSGASPLR